MTQLVQFYSNFSNLHNLKKQVCICTKMCKFKTFIKFMLIFYIIG